MDFLDLSAEYLPRNFQKFQNLGRIKNLTAHQCLQEYDKNFMTTLSDVMVVSSGNNASIYAYLPWFQDCTGRLCTTLYYPTPPEEPYEQLSGRKPWPCNAHYFFEDESQDALEACTPSSLMSEREPWRMHEHEVSYCLARETPQKCRMQFITSILVIVLISNLIKVICMVILLLRKSNTLLTLGDAIQSFLVDPDPQTERFCLLQADCGIS